MQKLNFNNVLRYLLIGGIFLIPFIPFYVAKDMFFPFIVGKNFAFRILIEILFGGWLILLWRDARYRPRFSWILAAFALFLGVTVISDLFGENLFRSFWSNFERMDGLVNYLHFFAYFLIIGAVLNTEKLWTRFFQTMLGASVVMALYAFAQLAGYIVINQGGARIDATLGNASYLGLYALFHVFLAAFLFVKERNVWWRVAYGAVGALNLIILYNTATRGAILGLIGGAVISAVLIVIFEKGWNTQRKIALGAILAIVVLIGALVVFRNAPFLTNDPVLARIASVARVENVLEEMQSSRFRIWEMGWKGFKEHPILGWGQENFNLVFSKYYDPRMYGQEPWFDRAHNVVLDRLVDGGAVGFLSYLSIFFASLYCLWRRSRDEADPFTIFEKSIFSGLFAAYFFQNLFIFDQFVSYFLFFSVLAYLHSRIIGEKERKNMERGEFGQKDYLLIGIVILGTVLVIYILSINGLRANRLLLDAIRPQPEGISKNLDYFNKALVYDHTVGIMETREQLAIIAASLAAAQTDRQIKDDIYSLAKEEMRKQIGLQPKDARYSMFLVNLFTTYGAYDDALVAVQEGIVASPKREQSYYFLGNIYIARGEYKKALEALRVPFDLAPENTKSRTLLAAAAIYAGDDAGAREALGDNFDAAVVSDPIFINAYVVRGRFDRVAEIWEYRIAHNDANNPQAYLSLAAAYAKLGKSQKAIIAVQKVMQLAPDFSKQGEELLQRIRSGDI